MTRSCIAKGFPAHWGELMRGACAQGSLSGNVIESRRVSSTQREYNLSDKCVVIVCI